MADKKVRSVTLRDGEHVLMTPSLQFYIDMQDQYEIDLTQPITLDTRTLVKMLRGLLIDNEPEKAGEYGLEAVGRLLDVDDMDAIKSAVSFLLNMETVEGVQPPNQDAPAADS